MDLVTGKIPTTLVVSILILVGMPALIAATSAQTPPLDYSRDCTSSGCHSDLIQTAVVHAPVASKDCDACHQPAGTDPHKFKWAAELTELCYECHDEDEFDGKVKHAPMEQGQCTVCHNPHGSEQKALLVAPLVADVCNECHEETTEDLASLHGPVAAGACTACHNPHASDQAALLKIARKDLCLQCHDDMKVRIRTKPHAHEPAKQDCTTCHNPHGGVDRMNLVMTQPQLCFECHDEVADSVEDAAIVHGALTSGRKCTGCHNPHAADVKGILIRPPMELCLSCHNKAIQGDSRTVRNIAALLEENPEHHGPVGNKNCLACHNPHASEHIRLLNFAYPRSFYAKFEEDNYALCFDCHDVEIFEEERTDELTGFRNGDVNLHYLHVNRPVKGRTCRACHDPHAAKNKKMIAESVAFGGWRIPLNYQPTASGGSCLPGCHKTYRYDRENAVANLSR